MHCLYDLENNVTGTPAAVPTAREAPISSFDAPRSSRYLKQKEERLVQYFLTLHETLHEK